MRRTLAATATAMVLMVVGCTADTETADESAVPAEDDGAGSTASDAEIVAAGGLTAFDACDDYLAYAQEHGAMMVGPYGLDDRNHQRAAGQLDEADDEAADTDALTASPAEPVPGQDYSETTVQEDGVDEPDLVKTDGTTVYAVAQEEIHVLDVTGDEPEKVAAIPADDGWRPGLMLHEDRLLIAGESSAVVPLSAGSEMPQIGGGSYTTLTLVDVSDPADPRVQEQLVTDGSIRSSRMVDGTVRLVTHAEPSNLAFESPEASGLRAAHTATQHNREVVANSSTDDWLPYYLHETADGDVTEGSLVACDAVTHPDPFSGLGTTTILSLDLSTGLLPPDRDADTGAPANATAVLAGVDTIYASAEHLYVVTNRWVFDEDSDDDTHLHVLDISDPASAAYMGSGAVAGRVSDQWALSEHDGHLRVVSTVGDTWRQGDGEAPASMLTVLEIDPDGLDEVGRVDDLGLLEHLAAVRFTDETAYVATRRQEDPLYTVDVRDPEAPQVAGELALSGPGSYLQPVDDDRMLALGRRIGDEDHGGQPQLMLLDVGDATAPDVLSEADMGQGHSMAEYDHHAFLHWAPTDMVVLPFQGWGPVDGTGEERPQSGAAVFSIADDEVAERDRLSQLAHLLPDDADAGDWDTWAWRSNVRRTLVVGDDLLTVSDVGVATYDLDTLDETGWVRFSD